MRVLLLFTVLLPLSASRALAQSSSSNSDPSAVSAASDAAEARVHFERGVEHYGEGNFDAALAELERAQQLAPTYKLLYNLAQVQMERHDHAAAIQLLTRYLREGGSNIPEDRLAAVNEDVARLRQRVSELSIQVDVAGAEVFVNDESLGLSPLREPVFINVGKCRVRVEKAGYIPLARTLSIAGAEQRRLSLTLEPRVSAAAQPASRSTESVGTAQNMFPFWLSLTATIGFGAATAIFGGLTLSARAHNAQVLADYPGRTSELEASQSRLQNFAMLTDVFGAATLVAGVLGLYFYLSPPERRPSAPAPGLALRIAPTLTGTTLQATF